MIGVVEDISHNMAEMCWSTIMHDPHAFPDSQWYTF
jgi:hypothetical protein